MSSFSICQRLFEGSKLVECNHLMDSLVRGPQGALEYIASLESGLLMAYSGVGLALLLLIVHFRNRRIRSFAAGFYGVGNALDRIDAVRSHQRERDSQFDLRINSLALELVKVRKEIAQVSSKLLESEFKKKNEVEKTKNSVSFGLSEARLEGLVRKPKRTSIMDLAGMLSRR
ncbi:MAG: hypothetical protein DCC75_00115 [Proteobacteria bacterium]|nr:MAG: hypothetical protein DCC75_00115 [Pseudomonadota bacterium]